MSAKTIRFDRSKCTACCACAMACMDEKNTDVEQGERAFRQVYTEEVCRDGQVSFRFHSDSCIHCRVPACVTACMTGCLYKDAESGLVLYDTAACDGSSANLVQRERTVCSSESGCSAVRMKNAYAGGSSSSLSSAFCAMGLRFCAW